MTKIYIIAGEPSGDFIGSRLIASIRQIQSEHTFHGLGGPLMHTQGLASLFDIDQLSLMGFFEILPKFFILKRLVDQTVENILKTNPQVLITIDSPGFTAIVAKKIKKLRPYIKLMHIVAPSVWAYRPGRAQKYAETYDHLLTLLPFEPPYFTKVGLDSSFVGHFISEQSYFTDRKSLRDEFNITENLKVLCITPGSRKGEIARHMPVFVESLKVVKATYPDLKIIFVVNNDKYQKLIEGFLKNLNLNYSFSKDRLRVFALADVALAKSGTNTLEIAASQTPMIVAYKLNPLTFAILKLLIKVKYASLINIIAKREIIPEYIQGNCTSIKIGKALIELLGDAGKRSYQVKACKKILSLVGFGLPIKPSTKAAELIIKILK